jgi:hypothetical protein
MTAAQRILLDHVLPKATRSIAAMDSLNGNMAYCLVVPGFLLQQNNQSSWEMTCQLLQEEEQHAQRILDELHAGFALPEVERATDLLPELVGLIGEFLSIDSHLAEYVSIHALPKAAHQQQQQQ